MEVIESNRRSPIARRWWAEGCLLLLVLVVGSGCQEAEAPPPVRPQVPRDLELEVINADRPSTLRCSPDIRLAYKVPTDVLEAASDELREREASGCDRSFITYYLSETQPGEGAWATAEYRPELMVTLLGLTKLEERELVAKARKSRELVGTWIDDTSFASVVTVYLDGDRLIMDRLYRQGGSFEIEIVATRVGNELRWEEKGGDELGHYYVINSAGNLEKRDDHGLLHRARLHRLDRDPAVVGSQVRQAKADQAKIVRQKVEKAQQGASRNRMARWIKWLDLYRDTLAPMRHSVLQLGGGSRGLNVDAVCTDLRTSRAQIPTSLRQVPEEPINLSYLEDHLARLIEACDAERRIPIVIEARATSSEWRRIDRDIGLVSRRLRGTNQ